MSLKELLLLGLPLLIQAPQVSLTTKAQGEHERDKGNKTPK